MKKNDDNKSSFFIQLHWVKKLLFSLLFLLSFTASAQNRYWTDFSNINDSLRTKPKSLMVFIHTDWCKYCKIQEQTSFADTTLLEEISKNYYCLKLNAESKKDIQLLTHSFKTSYPDYHTLALRVGKKEKSDILTFPTTVFLEPTLRILYQHKGLMTKNQFKIFLKKTTVE